MFVPAGGLADGLVALHDIRGEHALGQHDRLGQAGGPRRQHVGRRRIGIDGGNRFLDRVRHRCLEKIGISHRGARQLRWVGGHDHRIAEVDFLQRVLRRIRILGKHDGGLGKVEHMAQTTEVTAEGRVLRADRRRRHTRSPGAISHHTVRHGVGRQDQYRAPRRDLAIQQPLGDRIGIPLDLGVAGVFPAAVRTVAAGEVGFVAQSLGLARQFRCHIGRIRVERHARGQNDGAVGPPFDVEIDRHHFGFAERRGAHRGDIDLGRAGHEEFRLCGECVRLCK